MRTLAILALLLAPRQDSKPVIVADNGTQPQVAVDADGNVYVVFIRNKNIEVAVSTDKGATFGAPVTAIDTKGRYGGGMQRGPRIGVDAKKNVYVTCPVCLDDAEYAKKYPTQDLYLVASTDGGKTFSKPLMVNEAAKKAPESLHWMAVSPNGDVHVAWLDMRDGPPFQSLYYAKVRDTGKKVGKNVKIAQPLCECCAPGLAVDGKGNPIVAFREGGKKGSREVYAVASTNGGSSFGAAVQLNKQPTKEKN